MVLSTRAARSHPDGMTFIDIEISVDPSGLVLALLFDGARSQATAWAIEQHYLVSPPSRSGVTDWKAVVASQVARVCGCAATS